MNVEISDNFLPKLHYENVIKYMTSKETYRFESDITGLAPTGMISDIDDEEVIKIFEEEIKRKFPLKISNKYLYRAYINCFFPGEHPLFHTDSSKIGNITFIFYPCPYDKWIPDIGGETQFFDGQKIIGIPPIPNRMICFDGTLLHKATTFKNCHRFTIAFKYFLNNEN